MPGSPAEAAGSDAGTFVRKTRSWKPRCFKKPLTRDSASNTAVVGAPVEQIQPSSSAGGNRDLIQFQGVQYYNNYPGNAGQQMSWAYNPQAANTTAFPPPMNWDQQEEAVTSFALGAYQGCHGLSVKFTPENFFKLSPEQQAAFVNLGRGNNLNSQVATYPSPTAPTITGSEHAAPVVEEDDQEPPKPAPEAQNPKCAQGDKQITINIVPHHCHSVPVYGSPCYHGSVGQCGVFNTGRHKC